MNVKNVKKNMKKRIFTQNWWSISNYFCLTNIIQRFFQIPVLPLWLISTQHLLNKSDVERWKYGKVKKQIMFYYYYSFHYYYDSYNFGWEERWACFVKVWDLFFLVYLFASLDQSKINNNNRIQRAKEELWNLYLE